MPTSNTTRNQLVQFRNCYLLRDHAMIKDDLWVRDGKILNPEKLFFDERIFADVQIDCHGAIICAGYIDVQINGAFGVDFSLPSPDAVQNLQKVCHGLLCHGVTSFCPTVVTSPPQDYAKVLPNLRKQPGTKDGAGILGIHLEGPFINKEKCGAHHTDYITSPTNGIADLEAMYGCLDNVCLLTLAPELPGALQATRELVQRGIIVSVGHSMSNLQQGELAVQAGASFITHLFNAMLPFHHRDPHLVGLLASDQIPGHTVYYGMIADGIHTHPAALRIAHRTNNSGIVLVTDAVCAMGLSMGSYVLGRQKVEITESGVHITGTNTLAGSVATMCESVRYFYDKTECTKVEALEAATLHPAQLLNITAQKGTLDYNSDADFILLDDDLHLLQTYVDGELAYQAPKPSLPPPVLKLREK